MRAVLAREPDLAESDPARFAWWMVTVRLTSMQMWCGTHWRRPRESEDPCAVAHREGTAYGSLLSQGRPRKELLLPILLDSRRAQAGEAVLVDGILPGQEFLDRQRIAAARFVEREQPAAHGSNHLGLAPDDPAFRARCRQIGDRQRAAVRSDHVFGPRSQGLGH